MSALAKKYLKNSFYDNIIILAGAGMSVDSGLPSYRGVEGFWNDYPMAKNLGLNFVDMARPSWFKMDPETAWKFYGHRRNLYYNTTPHIGYDLLLDLVKNKNYFIITSNVDNLFRKASFDRERIVEIHGNIFYNQCTCSKDLYENLTCDYIAPILKINEGIEYCETCGSIARPNIFMFGDQNWNRKRFSLQEENYNNFIENLSGKTLIIEIGAGTEVPFIRNLSETFSKEIHSDFFRINKELISSGQETVFIQDSARQALKDILI